MENNCAFKKSLKIGLLAQKLNWSVSADSNQHDGHERALLIASKLDLDIQYILILPIELNFRHYFYI